VALVQLPVGTGAEAFFTFLDPEVLPVPAALAARLTLSSFNTLGDLFNFFFLLTHYLAANAPPAIAATNAITETTKPAVPSLS
jgi:hypothetical protein